MMEKLMGEDIDREMSYQLLSQAKTKRKTQPKTKNKKPHQTWQKNLFILIYNRVAWQETEMPLPLEEIFQYQC